MDFWNSLCRLQREFRSPYFHPSFTRCVNEVRADVSVVVASNGEQTVGVLPIQIPRKHSAVPVGGKLNDIHGFISKPKQEFDFAEMLRQTHLDSYDFHARKFESGIANTLPYEFVTSPVIQIRKDFETYLSNVKEKSRTIKRQGQKTRKLEREVGPLRFEFNCRDRAAFEHVLQLKQDKYHRTKTFDLFSVRWARDLLNLVFDTQTQEFGGVLSVLWAGDEIVAGHYGVRSTNTLHYWFPIVAPEFGKYSPGIQLVLEMCREATANRIQEIDLGYGNQEFKYKLANDSYQVLCGTAARSAVSQFVRQKSHFIKKWFKSTPAQPLVKSLVRTINPRFGQSMFR